MGLAAALRPFAIWSPRTVLWMTLVTGCIFAAYAHYAISSIPSYIQVSTSPALAAALPHWVLWSSAVQVAAAALALAPLHRGRAGARRGISLVAVLAGFASNLALFALLCIYVNYMLDTWSCYALERASTVASMLLSLVLQLIALALLW